MVLVEIRLRTESNASSTRPLHLFTKICKHRKRLATVSDQDGLKCICLESDVMLFWIEIIIGANLCCCFTMLRNVLPLNSKHPSSSKGYLLLLSYKSADPLDHQVSSIGIIEHLSYTITGVCICPERCYEEVVIASCWKGLWYMIGKWSSKWKQSIVGNLQILSSLLIMYWKFHLHKLYFGCFYQT